jgi:hypothetical protein
MATREQISLTASIPIRTEEKAGSDRRRTAWLTALALSGLAGIGCGIAGLVLSSFAAQGFVGASSAVRLAVPILVVLSLSLLMCSAHCLDRLHQIRIEK